MLSTKQQIHGVINSSGMRCFIKYSNHKLKQKRFFKAILLKKFNVKSYLYQSNNNFQQACQGLIIMNKIFLFINYKNEVSCLTQQEGRVYQLSGNLNIIMSNNNQASYQSQQIFICPFHIPQQTKYSTIILPTFSNDLSKYFQSRLFHKKKFTVLKLF
ncbi:hypothetical protein ABPG72_020992 [Tetrahymena utriculariae]